MGDNPFSRTRSTRKRLTIALVLIVAIPLGAVSLSYLRARRIAWDLEYSNIYRGYHIDEIRLDYDYLKTREDAPYDPGRHLVWSMYFSGYVSDSRGRYVLGDWVEIDFFTGELVYGLSLV